MRGSLLEDKTWGVMLTSVVHEQLLVAKFWEALPLLPGGGRAAPRAVRCLRPAPPASPQSVADSAGLLDLALQRVAFLFDLVGLHEHL